MGEHLDQFDLKLLTLLAENGRKTTVWFAKRLKCSHQKTASRMKKLEEQGVIKAYRTLLIGEVLIGGFQAILYVRAKQSMIKQVINELLAISNIYIIYHIIGKYDLEAYGDFENDNKFEQIVLEKIPAIEGVLRVNAEKLLRYYYRGKLFRCHSSESNFRNKRVIFDDKDLQIVDILSMNARASLQSIAKQMGMTVQPISERFNRLTQYKAINAFITVLDPAKIGLLARASIHVGITPQRFEEALNRILALKPEWVVETTGDKDLIIYVDLKGPEELRRFIREEVGRIDGVQKIESHVIVKDYLLPKRFRESRSVPID